MKKLFFLFFVSLGLSVPAQAGTQGFFIGLGQSDSNTKVFEMSLDTSNLLGSKWYGRLGFITINDGRRFYTSNDSTSVNSLSIKRDMFANEYVSFAVNIGMTFGNVNKYETKGEETTGLIYGASVNINIGNDFAFVITTQKRPTIGFNSLTAGFQLGF